MIHHIEPHLLTREVRILLVGAGGTGSHVLRRLATMHLAMVELGHPAGLNVTVIDPDTVSKTNVGRQNFYPSDVGQPKASILVNRCNLLMQTNWTAEQTKLTENTYLRTRPDIVIGCVDNRKGRAAILGAIRNSNRNSGSTYWIDAGNREHDGQVILGQVAGREKLENRLPHAADLFPEIVDVTQDETDEAPSCSLAEALEKQSLFINDTIANAVCNLLWELFRYGQIKHHGSFINLKSGRVNPLSIEPETWKRFGFNVKKQSTKRRKTVAE